ncbi:hypothetical protein ESCO_004762 [Escovopsis weberi]|uniref:Major facilitator superfamily transporter n=1 Tax=Escovopsis weberi TaxID=150374 RepID=A0A0M8MZF8_ESCWE|nr:hypothetical protein ESCO_004762 [Escovopsis weberi]
MGLLKNPLRRTPREQRIPLFQRKSQSSSKDRCSDDDYYTTDGASDSSLSGPSGGASSPLRGGRAKKQRRKNPAAGRAAGLYPYRLPSRKSRYVLLAVIGLICLMIGALVRASRLENWRVANGILRNRPAAPPLWEKFPFLERYYGGVRTLVPFRDNVPQYPRAGEAPALGQGQGAKGADGNASRAALPASIPWTKYPGRSMDSDIQECFLDAKGSVRLPALRYYDGRPEGYPNAVVGSYEIFKLPEDVCFERYGRYGPYGFGYSLRKGGLGTGEHGEQEGADAVWADTPRVDYRHVDWADVQRRCYSANAGRYKSLPARTPTPQGFYVEGSKPAPASKAAAAARDGGQNGTEVEKKPRTAVVVRCWDEYAWAEDDIANLRSLIGELSLASGGQYDVHILLQVKNDAEHPVWADHEIYKQRVRDTIPEEFRGLVTIWTETQMLALYQGIYDLFSSGPSRPVHGVYRGLAMAMQHFAYLHPEYDFFWQWEMDVRYTGHHLDLFTKLGEWARQQPRKGLWERSARFYLPSFHGSWEDFSQMARVQSEMGTVSADNLWKDVPGVGVGGGSNDNNNNNNNNDNSENHLDSDATAKHGQKSKIIWGPMRPLHKSDWFDADNDPVPPSSYETDRFSWGVGEDADLITLNPMFDPEGTTWLLRDDITGFNRTEGPPPRRASIITTARMSRRLLLAMHRATARKKQFAFPEMWPATVALHHGLKAVYAPHPVYVDRRWPVDYMAQTYNGGRDGSAGGARTSPFGDREHNFLGLSWFYNAGFGGNVYRRWLGLRVNNDGGEEFERSEDRSRDGRGVGGMRGGEGRMCLPPMLLHPVKDVKVPVEGPAEEEPDTFVSDPAAV